ncbi:putative TETRONASIN-TRANSPORT INTEGRAL MEMBRANE PROTEIN ABC TRANSPORTER [Serinicoccus hydrothermalis]|uniref:Putative TETRONASIN-TRANSPORT INTEGRAL MEMBRANE PROTEIN ABC TRANSPORTER n=1 Tax=Serinicoccus hydrothermalis TaxID=1758689 RepID=A0A1B1NFE8_9MICO|nr:hypothetical protein [Serinicoccus hydrothermalis]ANS80162.1 putative TETRONASIN-TRANSPORT INTEGRAL MEMBRANE PROTEIN ABC TRANSPORTER [Serinicoccus hydrothermalis]
MTGLGELVRLAARRSRWFYLAWVLALTAVVPATAAAYEQIIDPDNADLLITTMTSNPTMRAMLGPPFDLSTAGGFTVWRVGTFVAAMASIMAVLGIIRSTRAQEEDGRTELLRSASVGRHVPLVAGMLVTLAACLVLGVLVAASMTALGEPVVGSVAFGAGLALVGATFAAVGALAAQLSASARTARAIGLWTVAAAYTLRAVADGSSDDAVTRLAWASPLQWMALARPYAGERWWVLLLPAAATVLLLAGAVALEARRDHGSGLWAARSGRAEAPPGLRSGRALAWRLHRGQVIGWSLGLLLFAIAMGSLSTSFGEMLEQVPQLQLIIQRMGGGTDQLTEAFFVTMLGIVSVVVAVLAVQLFGRLHEQEERGHAELVLSTALSRRQLLASHLGIAVLVPVVLFAAVGAVLALNQARATGDWSWVARTTEGALALAPGGLVALGVAVLLHGWAPRLGWLAWVVIGWSLFMVWVGAALDLPEWLTRLTPWAALPQLPVDTVDWTAVLGTLALAVVLIALGALGYRRRDITGT